MPFLHAYPDPADAFMLASSLGVFAAYLLAVLAGRAASGEHCTARLNTLNFYFFTPYAAAAAVYALSAGRSDARLLSAFLCGSLIYLSLHHVYLMSLMGLAKKSVSVNLLEEAERTGDVRGRDLLQGVRENRLLQMKILDMARLEGGAYRITPRGRFYNALGSAILKLWGMKRL